MKTPSLIAALALALTVAACGKELGRVPFPGPTTSSATVPLAAGEVAFWTDIDIEYEGDAALHYDIELQQAGATVAKASCDPLRSIHVKVGWVETNIGRSHSRKGSGKMSCSANVSTAGPTTVNATLAFSRKPTSVKLARADLVLKQ